MTQLADTWAQVRDLTAARQAAGEAQDARLRPLTDPELAATVAVGLGVGVLGVIGLVTSFATVRQAAVPAFGAMAWLVPLGIDVGILVFSALDLVLARLDMRVVWLRLVPWSLTAATIYLNIADETTLFGQVAHGVLPGLWVVAIEVGTHAVRVRAGLGSSRRMDTIRRSRWLLAPASTLGLWRRMVLWEITAYPDALARERSRLLALTDLKDRYGFVRVGARTLRLPAAWRWRAPRRDRALYRLGELTPTPHTDHTLPPSATPTTTLPRPPKTRGAGRKRTGRGRSAATPDVTDLQPVAEAAAARIAGRGEELTRASLAAQLRAAGHQVGNAKLGALLAHLRTHHHESRDTSSHDSGSRGIGNGEVSA